MPNKYIPVEHISVDTNIASDISEAKARQLVVSELNHLIDIANSDETLNLTISAAIQQLDNRVQYRNVNAVIDGNQSSTDHLTLGWQHTVSSEVTETFQRLAEQAIPEYVLDTPTTEINLGNAQLFFKSRDISPVDCMCEDSTDDDED